MQLSKWAFGLMVSCALATSAAAEVTPVADTVKPVPFTTLQNFITLGDGLSGTATNCDTAACLVRGDPNAARLAATVPTVAGGRYLWRTQFHQVFTMFSSLPRPLGSVKLYWNGTLVGDYENFDTFARIAIFNNLVATGPTSTFEILARQPQIESFPGALYIGTASSLYRQTGIGPVPVVSDVPEPATWAMMLGGFGMVGGALRRRIGAPAAQA